MWRRNHGGEIRNCGEEVMEETKWRIIHGGEIWRRNHRGEIMERKSWRRNHGGEIMEEK